MKKRFGILMSIALAFLIIRMLPGLPADAQGERVILRPDPLSSGLMLESQGSVNMILECVSGLYGVEFHLAFDPDVVVVVDSDPATEGIQIEPAGWWENGFVAINQVDNEHGKIDFAATLLRPALPASGNQVVAVINFSARNTGVSALSIEAAILSTPEAQEISFTKQNGGIGVSPDGQAPELGIFAEATGVSPGKGQPGRLALAGLSMLVFLAALGVFIHALRRR